MLSFPYPPVTSSTLGELTSVLSLHQATALVSSAPANVAYWRLEWCNVLDANPLSSLKEYQISFAFPELDTASDSTEWGPTPQPLTTNAPLIGGPAKEDPKLDNGMPGRAWTTAGGLLVLITIIWEESRVCCTPTLMNPDL